MSFLATPLASGEFEAQVQASSMADDLTNAYAQQLVLLPQLRNPRPLHKLDGFRETIRDTFRRAHQRLTLMPRVAYGYDVGDGIRGNERVPIVDLALKRQILPLEWRRHAPVLVLRASGQNFQTIQQR